jgi:hypothetical protein
MPKRNNKCLLSVATYGYLSKAIVSVESFIKHNPDCDVILFVPDLSQKKVRSVKWPVSLPVKIIGINEIEDPLVWRMHQYFNAFEFCCAAKSFLLEYALLKCDYKKAVLLDPDTVCYSSFDEVWSILDNTDMVVTPHINSPIPEDECLPDDREFVNSGFINGGFWGASKTEATKRILDWMKKKVSHLGFFIPDINLYADQTWMSCLPWFFYDNVNVCRNSGLNVAYWNLQERALSRKGKIHYCNGHKLLFFHFSGYEEKNPVNLTIHTKRTFSEENKKIVQGLLDDYSKKLETTYAILPTIEPDKPCNNQPLNKRINIYRKVHGINPGFTYSQQRNFLLEKCRTILRKAKNMAGKIKYRWQKN